MDKIKLKDYTEFKFSIKEFVRVDEIVKFEPRQTIEFFKRFLLDTPLIFIASELRMLSYIITKINDIEDNNERFKMFKPWIGKTLLKALELKKEITECIISDDFPDLPKDLSILCIETELETLTLEEIENIANEFVRLGNEQKEKEMEIEIHG